MLQIPCSDGGKLQKDEGEYVRKAEWSGRSVIICYKRSHEI